MKTKCPPLAVAILCCGLLFSGVAFAQTVPRRVEIRAQRFSFQPSTITLKKGEPVVLVLRSSDVAHGIRFRELNILLKVKNGGTSEIEFTPEKTGDFVSHCAVFCGRGHGSMTLTIHVVE